METRQVFASFIEIKELPTGEKAHVFLASDDSKDRQGEIIDPQGWKLVNYRKNPVVLDSHNYHSIENIVGRAEDVTLTDRGLESSIVFNNTERGRLAEALIAQGNLRAVSVGFISLKSKPIKEGDNSFFAPQHHLEQELLEISTVPVPANAAALQMRSFDPDKAVIPPHTTGMDSEDGDWDVGAEMRDAGIEDLQLIAAWYDVKNSDLKPAYKMIHHRAGTHNVVWRGVAAGMAALMSSTGGAVPDVDRRGVYDHLVRHYRQFDRNPPEFRSIEDLAAFAEDELSGQFWEGEELYLASADPTLVRAGAVLSQKNKSKLTEAAKLISDVLAAALPPEDGDDGKSEDFDVDAYNEAVSTAAAQIADMNVRMEGAINGNSGSD